MFRIGFHGLREVCASLRIVCLLPPTTRTFDEWVHVLGAKTKGFTAVFNGSVEFAFHAQHVRPLLDEFDFSARPSVNKPLLLQLVQGEYLDKRENLLFVGPSGTGKSHLATALGMAACAQGRKVRFFRVTELITLLLEAKEERQLLRLRQQLGKLDLLILDELGYVPASKAGAELLFDVIATAYERNSLIVTTNLPFENWTEVLGSERLTGAAVDRLTHRCHILETTGESYRLQDAKRRRGRHR